MNFPLFMSAFHLHEHRMSLQPSLVYAVLALSTFLKSSNLEEGQSGRERACKLIFSNSESDLERLTRYNSDIEDDGADES